MKKLLLLIFALLLSLAACTASVVPVKTAFPSANSNSQASSNKYIGMDFSVAQKYIENEYPNSEKECEYSYITPKDCITNIVDSGKEIVYVSLGKPDEENITDNGISNIKNDGDTVYMTDNENLYLIQDDKCKEIEYYLRASYFDIENNNIYYPNENGEIYKLNLEDGSLPNIITFENCEGFVAVNHHIYYSGNDGRLYRMTENGNEKTLMAPNLGIGNIRYSKGWVYFIDSNGNLIKVKTDGSQQEILINNTKDYLIDMEGDDIIAQSNDDKFYHITDGKVEIVDNLGKNIVIPKYLSKEDINTADIYLAGYEDGKVYLAVFPLFPEDGKSYILSFLTDNRDLGNIIVHDYINENIMYSPIVINGKIYYYETVYNNNKGNESLFITDVNTLKTDEIPQQFVPPKPTSDVAIPSSTLQ